jgi:adenosylhomocysteine nucleosidase
LGHVKPILAVTGLNREGSVLRHAGVEVIAGGGDSTQLAHRLGALASEAAGIVSFGMAGALDDSLRLGDWVVGGSLAGSWQGDCDRAWAAALAAQLAGARIGTCYADGRLIADPAEKREIGRRYNAIAVDMESQVAARAAAEANIPFAILRCISDEVDTAVPKVIAVSMLPGGGIAVGSILRSVLGNPGQIPELIRIGIRFSDVYMALKAGAKAAGPRLAFDRR